VLTALAEGRVPDVKPNYEYFSQLLALQSSIAVRPKTCEIFVSSSDIQIREDGAYDSRDNLLDQASFPHLNKYLNCDDTPNVLGKDVLLHEYTRSMDRTTSACAKSVTRRWQKDAPAMYDTVELPARDEECLLMEMCATVELHEHAKFPTGSELTGFVEVAITQPALQGHRWKCVTRLTRPSELHSDDSKQGVYTNESGIHHRGCSDARPDCDCPTRPRQDIHVPFPAVEWASILSMAVEYPDVEHQRLKEKRSNKHAEGDRKRPDLERAGSKRKRSEDEGDAAAWSRREPTGSDLICKVAMYQELWSCAPDSTQWTRQGILFWRFNTTNQWYKYNPVFKPAGTTWRWLTVNDPMSHYHQQKALVYPSSGVSRDAIMSPTPTINQHLTAAMSETFSSAWDNSVGVPHPPSVSTSHHHHNGMSLFDTFSGGLATPPPSASLNGSYSSGGSFDSAMASGSGLNYIPTGNTASSDNHNTGLGHSNQSFYDSAGGGQSSFADVKSMNTGVHNPYTTAVTSSLNLANPLVYDNTADCEPSLQGWDMSALDNWTGTTNTGTSNSSTTAGGDPSSMWNPVHWGPVAAGGTGTGGADRAGSPRDMKRRRTDGMEPHVPVTAGW
jgi:transcriptional enhancer factor